MKIDWEKTGGLLPAVVQESASGEVLMLAYMNEEALNLSLKTGFAHYFSRTKNRIWKKGEESGNTQAIDEIFLDCDNDTILLKVVQNGGAACHTGAKSCFFRKISGGELNLAGAGEQNLTQGENLNASQAQGKKPAYGIIDEIYHVIMERKLNADPQTSYVASLFKKGENAILKKVGEEATELVMACKDASAQKNKISIVAYSDLAQIDEDMKKMREKEARDEANLCGCDEAYEAKPSDPQSSNLQNLSANGSEQKTAANLNTQNEARTEQNLNDKNSQPNLSDDNKSQNARKKLPESNVALVDLLKIPQSQIERIKDEISRGLFPDEYRSLSQQEADIIYEAADLCFHSLIALAAHGIHPDRVKAELARRFGLSGIEEKNSRKG